MLGAAAVMMMSLTLDVALLATLPQSKTVPLNAFSFWFGLLCGLFFFFLLNNKANVVEKPLPGLLVPEHWYLQKSWPGSWCFLKWRSSWTDSKTVKNDFCMGCGTWYFYISSSYLHM